VIRGATFSTAIVATPLATVAVAPVARTIAFVQPDPVILPATDAQADAILAPIGADIKAAFAAAKAEVGTSNETAILLEHARGVARQEFDTYRATYDMFDAAEAAEHLRLELAWESSVYQAEMARMIADRLSARNAPGGLHSQYENTLLTQLAAKIPQVKLWFDGDDNEKAALCTGQRRPLRVFEATRAGYMTDLEMVAPALVFADDVDMGLDLIALLEYRYAVEADTAHLELALDMASHAKAEHGLIAQCAILADYKRAHSSMCDTDCSKGRAPGLCKSAQNMMCKSMAVLAGLGLPIVSNLAASVNSLAWGDYPAARDSLEDAAAEGATLAAGALLEIAGESLSDSDDGNWLTDAIGGAVTAAGETLSAGGSLEDAYGAAIAGVIIALDIDFSTLADKVTPLIIKIDDTERRSYFMGRIQDATDLANEAMDQIMDGRESGQVYLERALEMLQEIFVDVQEYLLTLGADVLAEMGIDTAALSDQMQELLALAAPWIELAKILKKEVVLALARDYSDVLPQLLLQIMPRMLATETDAEQWASEYANSDAFEHEYSDQLAAALWVLSYYVYGIQPHAVSA